MEQLKSKVMAVGGLARRERKGRWEGSKETEWSDQLRDRLV